MKKEDKTNVCRILDAAGVKYTMLEIETDKALSGTEIALRLGFPPERTFKTLVTAAPSKKHYVFAIPSGAELDLKKAAHAVGEKSVAMIRFDELLPVTGYVHGGCSPVGMKKLFTTVLDDSARSAGNILLSAGRIGRHIEISPAELARAIPFSYADVTAGEH